MASIQDRAMDTRRRGPEIGGGGRRRGRIGSLVTGFIGLLLLAGTVAVSAMDSTAAPPDPGAMAAPTGSGKVDATVEFWRKLKAGESGRSTVGGVDAGVAIDIHGQNWRQVRNRLLAPWGAWLMGGVLFSIAAFYVLRGPIRLEGGGNETVERFVERFSVYQRIVHWFTVILFLLLGCTGLLLLYGRMVLLPLFGAGGNAAVASAAKEAHNLFGPIFLVALVMLIIAYVRDNLLRRVDISWVAAGGGLLGRHASAGRFNFGEKVWFWLVSLLGSLLVISGLVLDFTVLGWGRNTIQLAHFAHGAAAMVLIAVSFGHIYLATIGTEGTLRGMLSGRVDRLWARQHHDRWLEQVESSANRGKSDDAE
jgi:formate dehydrogenase subunit gamma